MGYTMVANCPGCGHTGPHDLTAEHFDHDGFLCGYTAHCQKCELVWIEAI